MRKANLLIISTCIAVALAISFAGWRVVKSKTSPIVPAPNISGSATGGSPADLRIQKAEQTIKRSPEQVEPYNALASAYLQKARETSDFGFNGRAEAAINRALELEPQNYDATKLRIKLLLTYHRFSEALESAQQALSARQDDHDLYGAITDAQVELGHYPEAIEAAQKMVDLRPDSSAYARISYLRSLHGDVEGAIKAMTVAVKAANPNDPEGRAWVRVHLGDELMNAGRRSEAEQQYDKALLIFPNYPLALAAKARARFASGDSEKAIELFEQAETRVPLPDVASSLGDLYTKAGRDQDAKRQYELVEFVERGGAGASTFTRQLALFWADHDQNLAQALEIAQHENTQRQDIYTSDTLAWCLYKNGRFAEAKTEMTKALRLGTRDARLFFHAGMIYHALDDRTKANQYLKSALGTNPGFGVLQVDLAKQTLAALKRGKAESDVSVALSTQARAGK